jgi:hypothetical protein
MPVHFGGNTITVGNGNNDIRFAADFVKQKTAAALLTLQWRSRPIGTPYALSGIFAGFAEAYARCGNVDEGLATVEYLVG